jgi:hypothetical protein
LSPSAFLPAQRRVVSERVREFPPPTIYRLPARRNDLGMYWLERRGLTSRTLGAAAAAGRRRIGSISGSHCHFMIQVTDDGVPICESCHDFAQKT